MDLFSQFNRIITSLNLHRVDYVLIGGYAVILHGLPRITQDMDIMLEMSGENINRFQQALKSLYDDKDIEEINKTELDKYAVIRYGTPDGFYIDVMSKIGETADYHSIESEEKKIEGQTVRVATAEALYKMKSNTVRPHDQGDAAFLRELIASKNKE